MIEVDMYLTETEVVLLLEASGGVLLAPCQLVLSCSLQVRFFVLDFYVGFDLVRLEGLEQGLGYLGLRSASFSKGRCIATPKIHLIFFSLAHFPMSHVFTKYARQRMV